MNLRIDKPAAPPAIETGRPRVPVLRPLLPSAERIYGYLRRIDQTRIYSNYGPLSLELERRLADHLRLPDGGVVCASSGTAALIGAILAAAGRAAPNRPLAIVPACTFAATAAAAEQCGYCPYLADIDRDSWMLDPQRLLRDPVLPRVGLVIAVAPFGRPVPQFPWQRFRALSGIPVIIDGAASFAALADDPGKFLGEVPVAISFHATKAFGTGEGGAVAVADPVMAHRIGKALNFGIDTVRDSSMASTNGKMSEYHAAVGLAELDGWPEKLAAWRLVAARYRQAAVTAGLGERLRVAPEIAPNYVLALGRGVAEAERAIARLQADGIDFRLWYGAGLHRQTYYADAARGDLGVTDDLLPRMLGLPVAPDLAEAAIARVVQALAAAANE